jgi:alpha-2-macroglobulin
MSFIKHILTISSIFLSGIIAQSQPSSSLQIIRITPQGTNIPEVGQVIIEFDRPMMKIDLSNPKDLPIAISPEVKGSWRWFDEKTLVLNIDQENPIKKATKYTIAVNSGLRATDHTTLEKEIKHEFVTSLPEPRWFGFHTWRSPVHPVIRGSFDRIVKKESLEAHLFFVEKKDKNKRIPAKLTSDEQDQNGNPKPDLKLAQYWIVEPSQELDPDKEYQLEAEPGILSGEGEEPSRMTHKLLEFKTFGEFKLLGFKCKLNRQALEDDPVIFTPENLQKPDQRCNPMEPIILLFSAPVMHSQVRKNIEIIPDPAGGNKEVNVWGTREDYSRLGHDRDPQSTYPVGLPYGLKAATDYTILIKQQEGNWWERLLRKVRGIFKAQPETDLTDEFGRKLEKAVTLPILLDDRKPNYVIAHHSAILEKQVDSEVPLYVNNLKSATFTYKALTAHEILEHQVMTYAIPEVRNIQFAIPFNVRQMLKGKSGVVYGTLGTDPGVQKDKYDTKAPILFAQVTPYQVQAKMGHFNTIVWVTDLATGEVVKDAKVSIYPSTLENCIRQESTLTSGITNADGIAILGGSEQIDPKTHYAYSWGEEAKKLFVRVEKDDDIALLPLNNDFEIGTFRASGEKFWSTTNKKYQHLSGWGTTAQGVYRAGDKVQYKFYIRNQSNQHFVLPPKGKYDLEVTDPTNKVVYEVKDLTLNDFGAFSGEFTVPKNGAVGWYRFEVKVYMPDMLEEKVDSKTGEKLPIEPTITFSPMQVLISDFTPSPFKVTIEADGVLFRPKQDMTLTAAAKLHAGGAYTDAEAETTAVLKADSFKSKHPVAENFFFGEAKPEHQDLMILHKTGHLDSKGEYELKQNIPEQPAFYGKLLIEGKIKDDRGKSVAANKTLEYIGGDRLVGLKQKQWVYAIKKPLEIEVIVVDEKGTPVSGIVDLKVEKKDTSIAKVKSAGAAYKTNANHEWLSVTQTTLESTGQPVTYHFIPEEAGTYKITARTKDDKNREHTCEIEPYVTGEDFVLWGDENDTYLPVIPEKNEYQVGDVARFLVKNPYPHVKALVTVERFGVIESFVKTLENNTPVIEIPIKEDYLPNCFVSVTVLSPRVASNKPLEVGQLDLAKPAFRMGYAKITIVDPYKEVTVTAKSDKETYKPREKVKIDFTAAIKHPGTKPEPIELAVVVIDDAVFDLILGGRQYYNPYQGFYKEETLDLTNYSLLNGLVGRMKFEKKGANPGGDGGVDLSLRNIFKFVSYWNPSLPVDVDGKATVEFEAPDNLTSWRVFAIAVTPHDRMGLGEVTFKVNRSTEVRPVMPNQIAEGDQFNAGFSVMNRMDQKRNIKVSITAHGAIDEGKTKSIYEQTVSLEPFKRTVVYMPIQTSRIRADGQGIINFDVTAGDEIDQDKVLHEVPVKQVRVLQTTATFGSMTEGALELPITIPGDIFTDVGGIRVALSPSMISNISGVFTYMKNYPYSCWEQKSSRAVIAGYYKDLKRYLSPEVDWPRAEDLVNEILEDAATFQANNGGLGYYRAKDDYVDPFLSAFTGVSFAWLKEQGYTIPKLVEERLLGYLDGLLKEDFVESYYTPQMVATTRAVVLEALSYHGKVTVADLERFLPHVHQMNAYGKSSFARAAMNVEGAEGIAENVIKELMSHFNETSTQMTLAENHSETSLRILDTPLRETCSALDTFVRFSATPHGKSLIGEKAIKLAKTVVEARKSKVHWENTQENLYCARALTTYSKVYEAEQPHMTVKVAKGHKEMGKASFTDLTNKGVEFKASFEEKEPGTSTHISIIPEGSGRLYYTTQLQAAPKAVGQKAVNSGLEVRRDYSVLQNNKWVLVQENTTLKRGDLVRVDLYVMAPGDRTFVVVNDPVPGCLEPVNKNLATTSIMDQRKLDDRPAEGSWWHTLENWIDFDAARWSFYHKEMRHESVRFYADYLPKGNYYLSYVAQVIADGEFGVAATLAEEMYNPETYGRGEPTKLIVTHEK